MWKDGSHTFSDLILYAKEKFLCTAVTTNGTFPLNIPADLVWISLDGTKEVHDRLRNSSFDKVMKNLKTLLTKRSLSISQQTEKTSMTWKHFLSS